MRERRREGGRRERSNNPIRRCTPQVSCYRVLRIRCLVIDLGHFTVVGKILFATFRLSSPGSSAQLLVELPEEDY